MRMIRHGHVSLALHELQSGAGEPLLLLGDTTREGVTWPGPLFALDFAGQGASDPRPGGAYTPELHAADADAALAAIGRCRIAGAGIGAYVALLLAGARADDVPAALLLPGLGLEGAGPLPDFTHPAPVEPTSTSRHVRHEHVLGDTECRKGRELLMDHGYAGSL